jgi:hypothetical protein
MALKGRSRGYSKIQHDGNGCIFIYLLTLLGHSVPPQHLLVGLVLNKPWRMMRRRRLQQVDI